MNFEVCTDTFEGAKIAAKLGAKRIELCAALSLGGLTPNFGLIKQCANRSSIEVHVMIRHREGNFHYSLDDVEIMKIDIKQAKIAGAHGVVFGILNEKNEVSLLNQELVNLAKSFDLEVTFHRAFDFVVDYQSAIRKLIELKFDRLLTSGLEVTAEKGLDVISYLQAHYGNQIQIMAGSGVNASNAIKIASSGINNLHFTARKIISNDSKFDMGKQQIVDEEKITNIINQFK